MAATLDARSGKTVRISLTSGVTCPRRLKLGIAGDCGDDDEGSVTQFPFSTTFMKERDILPSSPGWGGEIMWLKASDKFGVPARGVVSHACTLRSGSYSLFVITDRPMAESCGI